MKFSIFRLGLNEVSVDERLVGETSEVAKAEGSDLEGLVAALDPDELRLLVEGVASVEVADQSGSLFRKIGFQWVKNFVNINFLEYPTKETSKCF